MINYTVYQKVSVIHHAGFLITLKVGVGEEMGRGRKIGRRESGGQRRRRSKRRKRRKKH